MNLPVFDCIIDENLSDETGIYAISFVDNPANNVDFIALSSQKAKREHLCIDQQKQILTGVVLCPEQLIYRNDKSNGEYYIKFGALEIEKIARKMMRTGVALQNTTHQHLMPLNNNYLIELWIIEDPENDKSKALGFETLPKGTLMCSYKIEDKKYWDSQVMTGNVRGFSLEGLFFQKSTNSLINNIKTKMKKNLKKQTLLSRLTRLFLDIADVEKSDKTGSGASYVVFDLIDGKEVFVDVDGFATLDGEQLSAGEHSLSNGNILVVDVEGQFIETKESSDKISDSPEVVAPQALAEDEDESEESEESTNDDSSIDALKNKIADLESKLSDLASLAQEANSEVQKLRKVTPSTQPAIPRFNNRQMKRHERMAEALSSSFKNKKSN